MRNNFLVLTYNSEKSNTMLIISDFHDYYDSAIGFGGIDKSVVYNRKQIIASESSDVVLKYLNVGSSKHFNIIPIKIRDNKNVEFYKIYIIGFCGKLYMCIEIGYLDNKTEFIYDQDRIKTLFCDDLFLMKNKTTTSLIDELFKRIANYNDLTIFRKYKASSFSISLCYYNSRKYSFQNRNKSELIINPLLQKMKFQTIFEPFTAFQEIEMFLGGVIGSNENNIIEIEDKYRIESHGFDKWSFRNPNPPKRKI